MTLKSRIALSAVAFTAIALTSLPALCETVQSVVNVDLIPDDEAAGTKILLNYVQQTPSLHDAPKISLIQQSSASNHFIIYETFSSDESYKKFVANPTVRKFRADLYQFLGSPWDERLGHIISEK